MEKAPGIPLSAIADPTSPHYNLDLFHEVLGVISPIEFDVLMGLDENKKNAEEFMISNRDFHPGQIVVANDVQSISLSTDVLVSEGKVITILDWGQAVLMSRNELNQAVDLLRVVSGAESASKAATLLDSTFGKLDASSPRITSKDLELVLNSNDRRNVFMKTQALLADRGYDLPMAVVNWVEAIDRQVRLGGLAGIDYEPKLRMLIGMRKLGLRISIFNRVRGAFPTLERLFTPMPVTSEEQSNSCSRIFRSLLSGPH